VSELWEVLAADDVIREAVGSSTSDYLMGALLGVNNSADRTDESDLAVILEAVALEVGGVERQSAFSQAFALRRATFDRTRSSELDDLAALAHLACDGFLAGRIADTIMILRAAEVPLPAAASSSADELAYALIVKSLRAFLLLGRRSGGWEDVKAASAEIRELKALHEGLVGEEGEATFELAGRLLVGFNLARIVEIAAEYTTSGTPQNPSLALDRHRENLARLDALGSSGEHSLTVRLVVAACYTLVSSSIWQGTALLGRGIRDFVSSLADSARPDPLLQLWPSQRRALQSHLLDPARRAVVVQMPTSAGKTLLAEFSAIQSLALDDQSTVAYVVPTRALVNQVTQSLRRDLSVLGLDVEAAIPIVEIDPTEDRLLRDRVHVLVSTPEKLDLLIRSAHPSVSNISLVVVDEAHNLADKGRGARLEFMLATVKRERAQTRFLLLTPFVPNADELARWLGDDADSVIVTSWRPNERVAVTAHWEKRVRGPYELMLTSLAAGGNVDLEAGHRVVIAAVSDQDPPKRGKTAVTVSLSVEMQTRGTVLVLARGRGTAETRAKEIAAQLDERPLSRLARATVDYAVLELGESHPLPGLMRRGVAFHHAGLPNELRHLIELLVSQGDIDVITGTTTLAQGMNFPIRTVVVETLGKSLGFGRGYEPLTYSEFWNIAGRAGRALKDPLGVVAFPTGTAAERRDVAAFLDRPSQRVESSLATSSTPQGIEDSPFDLGTVRKSPDLAAFAQYLVHAARGGHSIGAEELEDLLRASLAFAQSEMHGGAVASALRAAAQRYSASLGEESPGLLALADGTGFSLASTKYLSALASATPELRSPQAWDTDSLFGDDLSTLTAVVGLLAEVPEMQHLGLTDDSGGMNASRVAGVIRDWVRGASLEDIGREWFAFVGDAAEERTEAASEYVFQKLVGQVPWGMAALQALMSPSDGESLSRQSVPALVYYGVATPDAALMRMAGVPRGAAGALGALWAQSGQAGESFKAVRSWIAGLTQDEWAQLPGTRSNESLRVVWGALSGI
jgi:helicase